RHLRSHRRRDAPAGVWRVAGNLRSHGRPSRRGGTMSTMPHWLAKTPEMVAMDRWFSDDLVNRYNAAITSVEASKNANVLPGASAAMNDAVTKSTFPDGAAGVFGAFRHLGTDWLNPTNPSSGGRFWPHVPTFLILTWPQEGVPTAARNGLGWTGIGNRGARPQGLV